MKNTKQELMDYVKSIGLDISDKATKQEILDLIKGV